MRPGLSARSGRYFVAFSRGRPVKLPNPGRIVHRRVNVCLFGIESGREYFEGPFDELPVLLICRKVGKPEKEMPAVATTWPG